MEHVPSWPGDDHLPFEWERTLAEGRAVMARLRALGEHDEANQLENEIADLEAACGELHAIRPRRSSTIEALVAGVEAEGYSPRWPGGHVGWVFSGAAQFERAARSFLAEGVARNERLVLVADDPLAERWPRKLLDRGALVLVSVSEVYGRDGVVVAAAQRETYAEAVAGALREGYSGIRVAADCTSLIDSPERLNAMIEWEDTAERFILDNPMTALCSYDQSRASADSLRQVVEVHRVLA